MANVIGYKETLAIQAFLGYLQKNYARSINPRDTYLIAAVAAWFRQESGSLSRVIGNNPFNIRPGMVTFMASGLRTTARNGSFLTFSSMANGFRAAAYLLMHASKTYGYQTALNALKRGGNDAAVNFLAALAMSSWSSDHYGAANWVEAFQANQNHLLRNYVGITGVQLANPDRKERAKARPAPPPLPRDLKYLEPKPRYLDPWAAGSLYRHRRRGGLSRNLDTKASRR